MLTGYINVWSDQIESEELELKDMKAILKHLEQPFGFIKGFQLERDAKSRAEERDAGADERK
jgi:hypothetical protein